MNKNDEDIDLRLALGSGNYSAQTRLHSSSGAGVNANSRLDMPFAASDPLSELVWSPHNGLSLKCANSGLADNKAFRTWKAGESTKEILTSHATSSLGCGDKIVSTGQKLSVSQTMTDLAGNSGDKATVFRSSGGSSSSEFGVHRKISHGGSEGLMEKASTGDAIQVAKRTSNAEEDLCTSQNVQSADIAEGSKRNAADVTHDTKSDTAISWKFPGKLVRGSRFSQKGRLETDASRSGFMGLAVPIRSEPPTAKVSEALVCSLPNLQAQQQVDDEATSASADVNRTKTDAALSLHTLALMKMESSAENDLGKLVTKEVHSLGEKELLREDDTLPVDRAPTNSRVCLYQEKGKEKALSEGEIYGRSSNERDDSHESVESCNSAGLLPKGIKRWQHYDHGQSAGSKRMKKCIHGSLSPTSIFKADSSFMNWISNMVKGVPDSNQEESSLLALTLGHSNKFCSNDQQELLTCNKTTEFAKPTGFQNVFQSLYCQTNKTYISGVQKESEFIAESNELMVADRKSLVSTPQSCNRNNDSSSKQIMPSDQEVTPHISKSPIKPWIFSADYATGNSSEKSLVEIKALDLPECSRGNSSGSLLNKVDATAEEMNLDIPLPVSFIPEKSSPLSSLWVTRLYTQSSKLENCNRITEEAIHCNSGYPKANPESRANDVFFIGQQVSEARGDNAVDQVHASEGEMQSFTPKESFGFSHKQRPIQPSQELRSSEAMASLFAKRLDALRHIIHPSEMRKPPIFPLSCFFCGNSGHDLRKCPDLSETELEDILVNISSFDRVDGSPCLCIKCFQVDHWAISCPFASSQELRQSNQSAVSVKQHPTCHLSADEKCSSHLGGEEDEQKQVFAAQVSCSRKPILDSFPNFLAWNMKESSSRRNELQKSTLSNLENHVKQNQMLLPCKLSNTQITVPQEEMFHAIRKLRLSRADILRWMDTNVSLSHLNGFFLRLRLGKLEGGLGGTGYYVACITGDSIENIGCKSKKSILVDVGGIKSSVGSQYISNHDFLEDEIKGWWNRIEKSGGKIPSLDELKSKFEDKNCLGL